MVGGCIEREGVDVPLRGPGYRWRISNVETQDFSMFMVNGDQHAEKTAGQRGNHEVHGCNRTDMVPDKRPPAL
jgi:hypothetical protein